MSLRKETRKTDLEIRDYLNSYSTSLCLAKWYNATIWLGSGQTTSCHHPLPHQININEIKDNPAAIHNTQQKKAERKQMQNNERPAGCQYCWKVEDIGRDNISDRVYKSVIYDDKDVEYVSKMEAESTDVNLKTLEIAFDRTCNFSCSYCNPAFSTEWVKDLKVNGPFVDLVSDGRNHFTHTHDSAEPFAKDETNPYVEAFFKWWESDLHESLQELRLTGGEPLMSKHTFRLLEWFTKKKTDMQFAINTNLGAKDALIDKLIDASHGIKNFQLYTSNESMFEQAEYIRDGLVWDRWAGNVDKILTKGSVQGFHMMCTVNALCLDTLPDFLNYVLRIKKTHGKDYPTFSLNILRFPSFQSALILPDNIRTKYKEDLQKWLDTNKDNKLLHQMELNQLQRLIDYLDVVKTPHDGTFDMPSLHNDFKKFFEQYDKRRGKNFKETFPDLAEWYTNL